jgi:hypothetical protein
MLHQGAAFVTFSVRAPIELLNIISWRRSFPCRPILFIMEINLVGKYVLFSFECKFTCSWDFLVNDFPRRRKTFLHKSTNKNIANHPT